MYKNNSMRNHSGFTLIEVVVVVVLIGVILTIVTLNFQRLREKYTVESDVKEIYSILMKARNDASKTNISQLVRLNANQLVTGPDAASDGTFDGSTASTDYPRFNMNCGANPCVNNQVIFDRRGLANVGLTIRITDFSSGTTPVMDCIAISATRINIGKMNGVNCVQR